ncbi:hypothetical protein Hanom_Chr14g01314981 [Helianthus anomalus]
MISFQFPFPHLGPKRIITNQTNKWKESTYKCSSDKQKPLLHSALLVVYLNWLLKCLWRARGILPEGISFSVVGICGRSTLRPTDVSCVRLGRWETRLFGLYQGVPLVGLRENSFVASQAVSKAESGKVAKHEKACAENQHVFIPFALIIFVPLLLKLSGS